MEAIQVIDQSGYQEAVNTAVFDARAFFYANELTVEAAKDAVALAVARGEVDELIQMVVFYEETVSLYKSRATALEALSYLCCC